MALLETIRCQVGQDCLVEGRLTKHGCAVNMDNAPDPKLVLDFDKPGSPLQAPETRCDYLVAAEVGNGPAWVVVLELKRGKLHANEVVRQLQSGAAAAEQLVPQEEKVGFRAVVFCGSASKHEREELRKASKIKFRKQREAVRLKACGQSLGEVL